MSWNRLEPWTRSGRRSPQTELSGTSPSPDASSLAPAPPGRWYLNKRGRTIRLKDRGGGAYEAACFVVRLTDGLLQGLEGDLLRQLRLQKTQETPDVSQSAATWPRANSTL